MRRIARRVASVANTTRSDELRPRGCDRNCSCDRGCDRDRNWHQDLSDERGAVVVIVAVAMVALFGFAAVAIDVGALYAERAQLQNGADAAALAIAQDCAASNTNCAATNATTTAQKLANLNANDGAAGVATPTLTASSVTVTTSTLDAKTSAGFLALAFAPVLGIKTATVGATAIAGWGSPAKGPAVLPLAFAPCAFAIDGTIQIFSMHGATGGINCSSTSPSGQQLPGGFGWLADQTGNCFATVDIAANAPVGSSTGVSLPPNCDVALSAAKDKTILVPVYEDKGGTGSGGWYKIRGWAALTLLGWNFPGNSYHNQTYAGARCSGSCKGLIGRFDHFVSLDERFTSGGPNLGAQIVRLQN
jgi:hypothetical protein